MTPLDLQDALCDEIKELLKDYLYATSDGTRVPINVFSQNIPVPELDDDKDPIPYLIVRLQSGDDDGKKDSTNVVNCVIVGGVMDDKPENQGYRDLLNIFQKIYQRFQQVPNLRNVAVFNGEFHWATQEDSYFPYFFGACTLSFNIPAIRREDPYA